MKATYSHRVQETKTEIWSFYFKPEKPFRFLAGQYTELSLGSAGKHWFTISSTPGGSEISITTRIRNSQFKKALSSLKKGDQVDMPLAMGDFVLPLNAQIPILMVAAGIGITPYLSILKGLHEKKETRNLHLIYGSRSKNDFVDLKPYLKMLTTYEKITRHIEDRDIIAMAKTLKEPYIYISGPEKMVELLVSRLSSKGIPANRLIADYFPGY